MSLPSGQKYADILCLLLRLLGMLLSPYSAKELADILQSPAPWFPVRAPLQLLEHQHGVPTLDPSAASVWADRKLLEGSAGGPVSKEHPSCLGHRANACCDIGSSKWLADE